MRGPVDRLCDQNPDKFREGGSGLEAKANKWIETSRREGPPSHRQMLSYSTQSDCSALSAREFVAQSKIELSVVSGPASGLAQQKRQEGRSVAAAVTTASAVPAAAIPSP